MKAGSTFTELSNGFARTDDQLALQDICGGLTVGAHPHECRSTTSPTGKPSPRKIALRGLQFGREVQRAPNHSSDPAAPRASPIGSGYASDRAAPTSE